MSNKNKVIIIGTISILFVLLIISIYNRARIIGEERFYLSTASPYNDVIKYIKTKNKGYVRWTSRIDEMNSKNKLTLKAPNIPKVVAFFDYSAVKNSFKQGDIITVSGIPYIGKIENNESSYYLKNCRIEDSSADDLKLFAEVTEYTDASEASPTASELSPTAVPSGAPSNSNSANVTVSPAEVPDSVEVGGDLQYISEDFNEFNQSYDNLTDLQKSNITKDLRFKTVLWAGYVIDVNKSNITFSNQQDSKTTSFIVYMSSDQKDAMLSINKGDKVSISAYILKCKGLTPWVLAGGKIEHP